MIVKIIAGTFGHRVGERVVAVKAGDDPIEVSEEVGARLVRKGAAVAVGNPQPDDSKPADPEEASAAEFPHFDEGMTRKELEGIALGVGIAPEALKAAAKKSDIVALLQEAFEEYQLNADAPTFDAGEAII